RGRPSTGVRARLAGFGHRRRRLVLIAWIVAAAGLIALGFTKGAPSATEFSGNDNPSVRAQQLLTAHFPGQFDGDSLTLAVHADSGVDDPTTRARVGEVLTKLAAAPHVSTVDSPDDRPNQVTPDRRTAFATVRLDVKADDMPATQAKALIAGVRAAAAPGVELAIGGASVDAAETPAGGSSEGIGLLATAVVLLIAFGS